jgi:flagellar motor switch/type III secretory pathway protein FliN
MSLTQSWLPKSTLQGERAVRPFAAAVADWAEAWFPDRAWRAAPSFQSALDGGDWSVLREESYFSLVGRPKATLDLAFAILGQRPRQDLTQADHQLMRRLAAAALDDLHKRTASLYATGLRQASGSVSRSRLRLTIGPDNQARIAIEAELGSLTALVKSSFRAIAGREELVPVRTAIAQEPVSIEAHLGSAALSIAQIETLEIGDIVVLDRPLDTPARISINNRLGAMAFALSDDGNNVLLTLQD